MAGKCPGCPFLNFVFPAAPFCFSPRNELTTSGSEDHYHLHLTLQAIVKVQGVFLIIITYWFQTPHHQNFNLFIHVHKITF